MPRLKQKTDSNKGLLRRVRRQKLRYIVILPSLITIINGLCGFATIILASEDRYSMAGYLVLFAMIADMLDGRLARKVENTSSFGGQLDSLCDVISFGVAPAFLMLKVLESELNLESAWFMSGSFLQRFIWVAAAAYTCCAAIRLARFNVENQEDTSAHMSFVGLPTPAAAGVIVSLIIFQQKHMETLSVLSSIIVFTLPFISMGIAILMVSRIRYPHVLNQYLRGKKPFAHLINVLLWLAFVAWQTEPALVLTFCSFAASGFAKWLYHRASVFRSIVKWRPQNVVKDA